MDSERRNFLGLVATGSLASALRILTAKEERIVTNYKPENELNYNYLEEDIEEVKFDDKMYGFNIYTVNPKENNEGFVILDAYRNGKLLQSGLKINEYELKDIDNYTSLGIEIRLNEPRDSTDDKILLELAETTLEKYENY